MAVYLSGCTAMTPLPEATPPQVLKATDFGVLADGRGDDGPAIQRLLEAARVLTGPVYLQFPQGRTVRATSALDRYLFRLENTADVTLDGAGCTFLLGPDIRFLSLTHSRHVTVRDLNIDFDPLPFLDGIVTGVNADDRTLDVRLPKTAAAPPLGGPTREDGEQAFFAMLWYDGPYGLLSRHCWVERLEPGPAANIVRVLVGDSFRQFEDIVPGEWRISLPVPGIAHRYGPGACLEINDNDTVLLENIELWSAPWFGVHVLRNRGTVTCRRVNIRPKPGSGRLTSTWRDGFHVKGNSADLLWEDCILEGMNDDAFNISTHCSRVKRILSPTRIEVQQAFPLEPMPWYQGHMLMAAEFSTRTLVGTARITAVTGWTTKRRISGRPAASPVTLDLDRPISGMTTGTMVWQPQTTNPNTILRRCTIRNSCRMQSPVTLESCDVTALLWFYGEKIEGPFPSQVTIRDCTLRRGRGNPRLAVSFAGRTAAAAAPSAIYDVLLDNNEIWGDLTMQGVDRGHLTNNRHMEAGARVRLQDCRDMELHGNSVSGRAGPKPPPRH